METKMGNWEFSMTSRGEEELITALNTAWPENVMAMGILLEKACDGHGERLSFFASSPSHDLGLQLGLQQLPFKISRKTAVSMIMDWLSQADHGPRPDTDGDAKNDAWKVSATDCVCEILEVDADWAIWPK